MKAFRTPLVSYNKVAHEANEFLQKYLEMDISLLEGYHSLKKQYSKGSDLIDYELYSHPFSYAFFLENFWKTLLVFQEDSPPIAKTLLDVGAGSGASSLAYLAWLDESVKPNIWTIEVTFLDRSNKQLKFLKALLSNFSFKNIKVKAEFVHEDFVSFTREDSRIELTLLSHVLNENISNLNTILMKAENLTLPNGKIYVLERMDDNLTWQKINEVASLLALNSKRSHVTSQLNKLFVGNSPHLMNKKENRKEITASYVSIQIPSNKNFSNLIHKYFEAWSKKSLELLEQVFSDDAVYEEKPFETVYRSLTEIKNYWQEKVLPQNNITIDILRITYTGMTAIVKWQAEFTLPKKGFKQVRGIMELTYDCHHNKISKLEEYFRTNTPLAWTSTATNTLIDSFQDHDIIQ